MIFNINSTRGHTGSLLVQLKIVHSYVIESLQWSSNPPFQSGTEGLI